MLASAPRTSDPDQEHIAAKPPPASTSELRRRAPQLGFKEAEAPLALLGLHRSKGRHYLQPLPLPLVPHRHA